MALCIHALLLPIYSYQVRRPMGVLTSLSGFDFELCTCKHEPPIRESRAMLPKENRPTCSEITPETSLELNTMLEPDDSKGKQNVAPIWIDYSARESSSIVFTS